MVFLRSIGWPRWCLSLLGTALLAGLAWYFCPLWPPFEALPPRVALVAAMLAVWGVSNTLVARRQRRRDSTLMQGVTEAADEVAALQQRLSTALSHLKRASGARGYLYQQPWYAMIGPPGAGKTTALLNAGLTFPLAAELGQGAIGGVGGTRLCDWWFTDEAVLIDTAGRYTTQDSNTQVDRAGWEAFLDLLKRTRGRQPLNGVIVSMALTDIARATAPERLAHARAIRHRLRELVTRLGVRIPVYALFTKADLIAGFSEFFDDLDSERRGQVWGTTFAETRDDAGAVAGFTSAFGELVARLNGRLYDRLQAERSPDRRALITGFPSQVASLEAPLAAFLQEAFGGSKLDPAPFLRGVYMTSGTQEGTPIDRLTGVLTRAFGLQQKPAPSLRAVRGRSYFLTRLLRDVVFQEAMLVADRPRARRRRFVLRAAGYTGLALITVLAGAFIWQTGEAEQHEVARVADALLTYDKTAKVGPLDPVQDGDLPGVLPLLDQARALPEGYDVPRSLAPAWSVLGLSQSAKLSATSHALYRNALERVLLPRLIWRLEAQMRARLNQPDFLYEATRVYLMLGGGGPLDPALVQVWMNLDWQAAYPGPIQAPVRAGLLRHLDALLADPLPPVSLDGGLVGVARATFNQVSFAQRVYSRIRPSAAAQRIPAWIPLEALGAAGATLFTRASGRSLEDGVPGFYTLAGFHEVLLPALAGAARSVAAESWVLGRTISLDQGQIEALESGVIRLYEADYAGEWDALMADLQLIPVRSLTQAAQAFYILGAPESPMRALLASIARQLTLSVPPGGNVSVLPNGAPGSEIDARYQALRTVMGTGAGAPIDQVLRTLNDLQQQLAKLAAAPVGTVPPPPGSNDPAAALKAIADKQPKPLAAWLASMAAAGISLRASGR